MTYPSVISTDNSKEVYPLPKELDRLRLPDHIAVIMDGNGRWAKRRGLPRTMGHTAGVEALKNTLTLSSDWGISALTVYAFSTENWSRPSDEVNFLMTLFQNVLKRELTSLKLKEVKINFLGDLDPLPIALKDLIYESVESTSSNKGIHFNVCTNYGGRRELVLAAQKLAKRSVKGELDPSMIDEKLFASELFTANQTDPDLLIRTSGEKRISNFLLWQLAYTEIFFVNKLWPDFNEKDYGKIIYEFHNIKRNFGTI